MAMTSKESTITGRSNVSKVQEQFSMQIFADKTLVNCLQNTKFAKVFSCEKTNKLLYVSDTIFFTIIDNRLIFSEDWNELNVSSPTSCLLWMFSQLHKVLLPSLQEQAQFMLLKLCQVILAVYYSSTAMAQNTGISWSCTNT